MVAREDSDVTPSRPRPSPTIRPPGKLLQPSALQALPAGRAHSWSEKDAPRRSPGLENPGLWLLVARHTRCSGIGDVSAVPTHGVEQREGTPELSQLVLHLQLG